MIIFLVTGKQGFTHADVLAAAPARAATLSYEDALNRRTLPTATYVFTDLDRLSPLGMERAALYYRQMRHAGLRVLNDPSRFVGRYALLRALHAAGINPFTAHRAQPDVTPSRWPVFLRKKAGHQAPLSDLIHDPDTLRRAIAGAVADGARQDDLIVVEYSAEPLPCGLFRKLSVYRIGDRYLADSCVHDRGWMAKIGQDGIAPPELYADELRIMRDNPFQEAVRPAFELAGIEYGRVDFGLVGGQPRIYEINTNPHVQFLGNTASPFRTETRRLFKEKYLAALAEIDRAGNDQGPTG